MPPSKVHWQCKAIRQKVCKSCEHVFRISEHAYYLFLAMLSRTRVWYSRMRYIQTAPRVLHFNYDIIKYRGGLD